MRSYETARQLSYESFIETFGKVPVDQSTNESCKIISKRRSMFVRPKEMASILKTQGNKVPSNAQEPNRDSASDTNNNSVSQTEEESSNIQTLVQPLTHKESRVERMSRKFRKISLRKRESSKPRSNGGKGNALLHRSKSVSFLGKTSGLSNRLSAFNPVSSNGRKSPVFDLAEEPMSKINSVTHRGYLSKRDEKRNSWTRYWCILQDACLYCYSTPNSDFADDAIALGGYYVITRFSGSRTQATPTIVLERPGKDSYEFKADSQKEQNEWILSLKKDILSGKRGSTKLKRTSSLAQPSTTKKIIPDFRRSYTDADTVSKAKAQLLEEIFAQQKEILREQIALEKLSISVNSPATIQKSAKTSSISSLAQSEDHGYCSSLDGSMHDAFPELDYSSNSRQNSPTGRSFRSMSTVSVASSASLTSIAEERQKPTEICPKVLAEIEEFRTFSKKTIERRRPKDLA